MSLSVEDLMQPRYKVIKMWPDMGPGGYFEGQIITLSGSSNRQYYAVINGNDVYDAFFDTFPHLFKKLEWWEERKAEEMPKYVRFGDLDKRHAVYKIEELHLNGCYGINGACAIAEQPKDYLLIFQGQNCHPATEGEYLAYKQNNP